MKKLVIVLFLTLLPLLNAYPAYKFMLHINVSSCANCDFPKYKSFMQSLKATFPASDIKVIYQKHYTSDYLPLKYFPSFDYLVDTASFYEKKYGELNNPSLLVLDEEDNLVLAMDIPKQHDIRQLLPKKDTFQIEGKEIFSGNSIGSISNSSLIKEKNRLSFIDITKNCLSIYDIAANKLNDIYPADTLLNLFRNNLSDEDYKMVENMAREACIFNSYIPLESSYMVNSIITSNVNKAFTDKGVPNYQIMSEVFVVEIKDDSVMNIFEPVSNEYSVTRMMKSENKYHANINKINRPDKNDHNNIFLLGISDLPTMHGFQKHIEVSKLMEVYNIDKYNHKTLSLFIPIGSETYFVVNPWNKMIYKYDSKEKKISKIKSQGIYNIFSDKDKKDSLILYNGCKGNNSIFLAYGKKGEKKEFLVQQYSLEGRLLSENIYRPSSGGLHTFDMIYNEEGKLLFLVKELDKWKVHDLTNYYLPKN